MSRVRTFLLSGAALVAVSVGIAQPSLAEPISETVYDTLVSQADTTTLDGTVVDIVSNRVRVRPSDGGPTRFYDINRAGQSTAGLAEDSPIELVLVDDEVIAVSGPSGQYQLSEYDYQSSEMATEVDRVEEQVSVRREETTVVEEREVVPAPITQPRVVERTEPVRALW